MKKHILRLRYNRRYFIFHLHKSDIFILRHVGTVEALKTQKRDQKAGVLLSL